MKMSKILPVYLIMSILFLPFISFAAAAKKPGFVGINEGQYYIWKTTFDKDPYEEYLKDAGYTEAQIETQVDALFDENNWDKDIEGWKIYIIEIEEEMDFYYKRDEVYYVPYLYNFYETEDLQANDWERKQHNARAELIEYDKYYYLDNTGWSTGFSFLFIDKKVDWGELADKLEDNMDAWNAKGDADDESRFYYYREVGCGISTEFEPEDTSDTEDFESVSRYNNDGVLIYYEWTYDGEIIAQIEIDYRFLYEYGSIILIIGTGVVGLLVVIIIIRTTKRRKFNKKSKRK